MRLLFMLLMPFFIYHINGDDPSSADREIPFEELEESHKRLEKEQGELQNDVETAESKVTEAVEYSIKTNKTWEEKKAVTAVKQGKLDEKKKPADDIQDKIKAAVKNVKGAQKNLDRATKKMNTALAEGATVFKDSKNHTELIEKANNVTKNNPAIISALQQETEKEDFKKKYEAAEKKAMNADDSYQDAKKKYEENNCASSSPPASCGTISTNYQLFKKAWEEMEAEYKILDNKYESIKNLQDEFEMATKIENTKSEMEKRKGELEDAEKEKKKHEKELADLKIDTTAEENEKNAAWSEELKAEQEVKKASEDVGKRRDELDNKRKQLATKKEEFKANLKKYETAKANNQAPIATNSNLLFTLLPILGGTVLIVGGVGFIAFCVYKNCYAKKKVKSGGNATVDVDIERQPLIPTNAQVAVPVEKKLLKRRSAQVAVPIQKSLLRGKFGVGKKKDKKIMKRKVPADEEIDYRKPEDRLKIMDRNARDIFLLRVDPATFRCNPLNNTSVEAISIFYINITCITRTHLGISEPIMCHLQNVFGERTIVVSNVILKLFRYTVKDGVIYGAAPICISRPQSTLSISRESAGSDWSEQSTSSISRFSAGRDVSETSLSKSKRSKKDEKKLDVKTSEKNATDVERIDVQGKADTDNLEENTAKGENEIDLQGNADTDKLEENTAKEENENDLQGRSNTGMLEENTAKEENENDLQGRANTGTLEESTAKEENEKDLQEQKAVPIGQLIGARITELEAIARSKRLLQSSALKKKKNAAVKEEADKSNLTKKREQRSGRKKSSNESRKNAVSRKKIKKLISDKGLKKQRRRSEKKWKKKIEARTKKREEETSSTESESSTSTTPSIKQFPLPFVNTDSKRPLRRINDPTFTLFKETLKLFTLCFEGLREPTIYEMRMKRMLWRTNGLPLKKRLNSEEGGEENEEVTKERSSLMDCPFFVYAIWTMHCRLNDIPFEHSFEKAKIQASQLKKTICREAMLLQIGATVVSGDIHGQFEDLLRMFAMFNTADQPGFLREKWTFMGDIVDRGKGSLDILMVLAGFKISMPKNFNILRGNHECEDINRTYGFLEELKERYQDNTDEAKELFDIFNDLFSYLPVAAIQGGRTLLVHGGVSPLLKNLEQLNELRRPIKKVEEHPLVDDLLWSDPKTGIRGMMKNERNRSINFGYDLLLKVLKRLGIDYIIRGHQVPTNGFEFFMNLVGLSIFSATSEKNKGAVAELDAESNLTIHVFWPELVLRDKNGKKIPPPVDMRSPGDDIDYCFRTMRVIKSFIDEEMKAAARVHEDKAKLQEQEREAIERAEMDTMVADR